MLLFLDAVQPLCVCSMQAELPPGAFSCGWACLGPSCVFERVTGFSPHQLFSAVFHLWLRSSKPTAFVHMLAPSWAAALGVATGLRSAWVTGLSACSCLSEHRFAVTQKLSLGPASRFWLLTQAHSHGPCRVHGMANQFANATVVTAKLS